MEAGMQETFFYLKTTELFPANRQNIMPVPKITESYSESERSQREGPVEIQLSAHVVVDTV
jgi:hypothetical protein